MLNRRSGRSGRVGPLASSGAKEGRVDVHLVRLRDEPQPRSCDLPNNRTLSEQRLTERIVGELQRKASTPDLLAEHAAQAQRHAIEA